MTRKQATEATLTAYEAARRLGTSAAYLYTLIYTGKLPAEKIAGAWRVPATAIDQRLKERETRNG
jgi:excisionase family DNA binding protein